MTAVLDITTTRPNGESRSGGQSGTPVETWAPAFAWLDPWTVESTQEAYRDRVVCKLCERPVRWSPAVRRDHLRAHLRELAAWRKRRERQREREAVDRLRAVNRLRKEGR